MLEQYSRLQTQSKTKPNPNSKPAASIQSTFNSCSDRHVQVLCQGSPLGAAVAEVNRRQEHAFGDLVGSGVVDAKVQRGFQVCSIQNGPHVASRAAGVATAQLSSAAAGRQFGLTTNIHVTARLFMHPRLLLGAGDGVFPFYSSSDS